MGDLLPCAPEARSPRDSFPSNPVRLSLAAKSVSVTHCACACPSPRSRFPYACLSVAANTVSVYPRVPFPRRKVLVLFPIGFMQPLEVLWLRSQTAGSGVRQQRPLLASALQRPEPGPDPPRAVAISGIALFALVSYHFGAAIAISSTIAVDRCGIELGMFDHRGEFPRSYMVDWGQGVACYEYCWIIGDYMNLDVWVCMACLCGGVLLVPGNDLLTSFSKIFLSYF